MKKFTKLAALSMSLLLAIGMCTLTACGDDKTSESSKETSSTSVSSEETKEYTCYEFTVKKADGTNADGYQVQLCIVNADGSLGACLQPIAIASGVCVYNAQTITAPGKYEVHVLDANYQTVEITEHVVTSETAFGAYEITLK